MATSSLYEALMNLQHISQGVLQLENIAIAIVVSTLIVGRGTLHLYVDC